MCLKNTTERFGLVAQGIHWLMALMIVVMLGVGFYMETMERGPDLFKLMAMHKAVGIIVLVLAVLRVIWVFMNVSPAPLPDHKKWEKVLAKIVQGIMYLAMIAMPLSGWIMSSAGGHAISIFGLFDMPAIVAENKELGKMANQAHGIIAWVLISTIVLHLAGAYKHKLIDKDETMQRMLPLGLKKASASENTEN